MLLGNLLIAVAPRVLSNSNISYSLLSRDDLNHKGGHALIGFNHGLPYHVKNMAIEPQ